MFGFIFLLVIECLKFKLCLKFNVIVLFFDIILGNFLIVEVIFVGILIIFLLMFNCFFLGFFLSCINGIFGEISRFLSLVSLSFFGFDGKVILLVIEYGGILLVFKYNLYVR